ncbi:hypothetical protein RRSWK_06958 [Rhodopirellula sp. SWK7]|nr:hypothetical protein RRSWK_06958 [Rhodopirellula sp. SWK7]
MTRSIIERIVGSWAKRQIKFRSAERVRMSRAEIASRLRPEPNGLRPTIAMMAIGLATM